MYSFAALGAPLYSFLALALSPAHAAPTLLTYNVDPDQISVSGLSSGGNMAVQMHVAFSSRIMGAGVLAAGPYLCAEGNVLYATTRCLDSEIAYLPSAAYFRELTLEAEAANRIDPTSNLADDKIWIYTGGKDDVVSNRVTDLLHEYYGSLARPANIAYLRDEQRDAQHAMITDDYGKPCGFKGGAYINDCDFDAAGALLQHIYGPLKAPVEAPGGNLKTFNQAAFSGTPSLGDVGYVYVPTDCKSKTTTCRLHVAFHGCSQNKAEIGDKFARYAGYNDWAEASNIILLYPQTSSAAVNQCWDWWGYTDAGLESNYPMRTGIQMAAVKAMIDRAAGIKHQSYCGTASNTDHVAAGRAYTQVGWWFWTYYYASGSDEYLGAFGATTAMLQERRPGYFSAVSSCP
jgi:hypothetical protein